MLDGDYICIFARKTKVLEKRLFWEKRLKFYMEFKGRYENAGSRNLKIKLRNKISQ